ncbi:26S proteasome regulatory subunit rpn2, partial [Neolecta irregularis DAH-3]
MVAISSANGLIALLDEPEPQLQCFALDKLNILIDQFWAEVADDVSKIEILYEDDRFPQRELAALVYYHLGEYEESLQFALRAGKLFDLSAKTEFVETIISNCIDKYIEYSAAGQEVDKRLQDVVERMFKKCFEDKEWKQAIGIALESRRLDVIQHAFKESKDERLMGYVLEVSLTIVQNRAFRNKVLELLVDTFMKQSSPDYLSVAKCLVLLQDSSSPAKLLTDLVNKGDTHSLLVAYQIAFDIESSATQEYLQTISSQLPSDETNAQIWNNMQSILSGQQLINLNLEFLCRNNNADMLILTKTKDSLEGRNSIFHSAVTFANAFMNAGTTSDGFFRQNLEWLGKASNWG